MFHKTIVFVLAAFVTVELFAGLTEGQKRVLQQAQDAFKGELEESERGLLFFKDRLQFVKTLNPQQQQLWIDFETDLIAAHILFAAINPSHVNFANFCKPNFLHKWSYNKEMRTFFDWIKAYKETKKGKEPQLEFPKNIHFSWKPLRELETLPEAKQDLDSIKLLRDRIMRGIGERKNWFTQQEPAMAKQISDLVRKKIDEESRKARKEIKYSQEDVLRYLMY